MLRFGASSLTLPKPLKRRESTERGEQQSKQPLKYARLGSSKRELGTGKTRRMTNSAIMTILNNGLPHCMLIDVLPGTKKQL